MKSLKLSFRSYVLLFATIFLFAQCNDDDTSTSEGNVRFEITDAPIDDVEVKSVFVTVTAIRVNGEIIEYFDGKQTIDLLAYQNGKVKGLGSADLAAGTYSDVELVLDYDSDRNGNAPGCYVLTNNGTKHALKGSGNVSNTVNINGVFQVTEKDKTNLVLDFDVRKAVTYSDGSNSSDYSFVTDNEMNATTRLVAKAKAGSIKGKVTNQSQAGSRIVVYAYKKGTYSESEAQPQGTSGIRFVNAISSDVVANDGSYRISFLEEGDYELQFVGYEDTNNDGKLEIKGALLLDLIGNLDLNNISVAANSEVSLDVEIKGILPF